MLNSKPCDLKGNQKVFNLYLNQVNSCCRTPTSTLDANQTVDSLKSVWFEESQQLTQGVELDSCEHCWANERQGITSFRQQTVGLTEDVIEIFLSNLCNQMCSYCSPKYSSQWQDSIAQQPFDKISARAKQNLSIVSGQPNLLWLEKIKDYINSRDDNTVVVRLLGGEPLMQIKSLAYFEQINFDKINRFEIVTNLNPPNPKFLHWILDTIPRDKLAILVSLDSTPDYNHVPRGLFDQQLFEQNLALLKQHDIRVVVLTVLSLLNVFNLKNFLSWLGEHGYSNRIYALNNPDCLEVKHIPLEFRKRIYQTVESMEPADIIRDQLLQPDAQVDIKLFEQYNYLNQYFNRTNIDPTQVQNELFKEYWSWLTQKVNK